MELSTKIVARGLEAVIRFFYIVVHVAKNEANGQVLNLNDTTFAMMTTKDILAIIRVTNLLR